MPQGTDQTSIEAFIKRWKNAGGTERANYQLFLTELCNVLDLPQPDPAEDNTQQNSYVFERRVDISNPDGSQNRGFIDLYRRGAFVLEAKQTGKTLETRGWDKAMQAAYNQADQYVRALPSDEGRPPFIVVTDVGRTLELYSEFSCSGGTYVPFPDPRNYRIRLDDLRDPEIQKRLQQLWSHPETLDPSRYAARVTRELSTKLAKLAKSLEEGGYEVDRVAHFLKRCLFTMFAEDVRLLPEQSFTALLERLHDSPSHFPDAIRELWQKMDTGGFCGVLMQDVLRFNGTFFKDIDPIPLNAEQIQLLVDAAKADWRYVEPAIFGTLLERALDPRERHKLGAHYTPRAYVERLVMPTIIEPLREEWNTAQVVATSQIQEGKANSLSKAIETLKNFHHRLCQIRVLDPACGSGNFLYVALEHMKRLEGEVLNRISELHGGQEVLEAEGFTVSPHQFHGLELNPRAAAIAEIVLWIGYLQWHYRIHGSLDLPEPILEDFETIENRDALIEYDSREPEVDEDGNPVTIWDGISMKISQTTGGLIPDEAGRANIFKYQNPRKSAWPEAEFIVGNPPFIGASTMRRALGDGYVDAVRQVYKGAVPDSADFVMYWWHRAAETVRYGMARRFGFITTNSLRQTFNRRVLEPHLNDTKKPLSLAFAVPDHPWVDVNDGAAVRIAMTVGVRGKQSGQLQQVVEETSREDREARHVQMAQRHGKIFSDLRIGADVAGTIEMRANSNLSQEGVKLHGKGFIVSPGEACNLGLGIVPDIEKHIRPFRNGRDLTDRPRGDMVIDLFGLTADEIRDRFPAVYQWVSERVKPERDAKAHTKDGAGYAKRWWEFGKPRQELRKALEGLPRYIATVKTAKHRLFQFLGADILPESKLIAIAHGKAWCHGVLSSRVHVTWSIATGSALEDRPTYVKTTSFERFPFPFLSEEQTHRIGDLAERIDALRKRQQAEYESITLTGLYNVLEKLRFGGELTTKEKTIHQQGLVSVLQELHDELDQAVFEAYGWDDLAEKLVGLPGATMPRPDKPQEQADAEEELLMRLVELNKQRAAEEAKGHVRWLRPEYQAPEATQQEAALDRAEPEESVTVAAKDTSKPSLPKELPKQITTIRDLLSQAPQTADGIASQFKRNPKVSVEKVIDALEALGQIQNEHGLWRLVK